MQFSVPVFSLFVLLGVTTTTRVSSFIVSSSSSSSVSSRNNFALQSSNDSGNNEEADRLKQKAKELREQIRNMEDQLGDERKRNYEQPPTVSTSTSTVSPDEPTLRGKRILVAGANGRLGSMVCRYLLRNHPDTEVVASVHYVGENSPTSRGYARLSYEVGAEDGVGWIGSAWSAEDRVATFEYDPVGMAGFNLQNLRIVECELLDPVQCQSVIDGCDAVIWCATDFNGNAPRAVASLDFALLFRAVSRPTKGRVEVEGLQNMMGALKNAKQQAKWTNDISGDNSMNKKDDTKNEPINFIHVSMLPGTFMDFETPFGSFWGIKERSEQVVRDEFPSLTTTTLQFGQFDDTFVEEDQDIQMEDVSNDPTKPDPVYLKRINRRDAARVTVDALLNPKLKGKTTQVWTDAMQT